MKRLHRHLRFRLQTLLFIILVVALGVTWFFEPVPHDRLLPDGACERTVERGRSREGVPHLTYQLLDARGCTLARGALAGTEPAGAWTLFHPDGRKSLQGTVRNGCRVGEWRLWRDGDPQPLTIQYGEPEAYWVREASGHNDDPFGDTVRVASGTRLQSNRVWLRDPTSRTETQFVADRRTGSSYVAGYRHGSDTARGWRVTDRTALLDKLERLLADDDLENVERGLGQVVFLGADAVPKVAPLLRSPDVRRRRLALRTLRRLGAEATAALPWVAPLRKDPDGDVRFLALWLFASWETDDAARRQAIRELIQDTIVSFDQIDRVREMARLGEAAIPALEELLSASEPPENRYLALATLGEMFAEAEGRRAGPRHKSEGGRYDLALSRRLHGLLTDQTNSADEVQAHAAKQFLMNP